MSINVPEGCEQSFQISLIKDEKMRPKPEYKFLVEVKTKSSTVVTCRDSVESAVKFALDRF